MNKVLKYIILACLSFTKLAANSVTITNESKHIVVFRLLFNDATDTDAVHLQPGCFANFGEVYNLRSLKIVYAFLDTKIARTTEWFNVNQLKNVNLKIIHENTTFKLVEQN